MRKRPKVSVIVPIYNVEKYLDRCLNTIINQTLKEIEIILVDDKSPDNCPKMCDEYAKKDNRIKVIHKSKNEGLGFARNSGIEIAKGEFIAFVDSDDYIDLDFYEKLYKNRENSDVIYGLVKTESNGKIIKTTTNPLNQSKFEGEEVLTKVLYNMIGHVNKNIALGISVCKAIYKREIFEKYKIRFCSERQFISEDYIFDLDYLPKCKSISFVDDAYYYYCYNGSSLTKKYNKDRLEKYKILYKEILRKTKKINIYKDIEEGINFSFIGNIRVCIKQETYNDKKKAIKNIFKICDDKLVQEVIRKKYNKSLRQKIFDYLILKKRARLLYFIVNKV